jgi:hypothetical protein
MRSMVLLIATVVVLLPLTARAAPAVPNRTEAASTGNIVLVDRRCGPGARWVRSGYARGKWRSAHCARL